MSFIAEAWRSFLVAARFLTRAPLPDPGATTPQRAGYAALFYPLVGLLLGAVLAGLWLLMSASSEHHAALAAAALLLVIWTWGTGALHLDGLGDCADAWIGGLGSRERTFEILKDPLTGSMGVVAIVLILIIKLAGLASLPSGPQGGCTLMLIPALARAQLLALPLLTASARLEGMGAELRRALPRPAAAAVVLMTWVGAVLLFAVVGAPLAGLLLAVVALGVLLGWRRTMLKRLGGFTGDTAGALVELTEALLLLAAVLLVPAS